MDQELLLHSALLALGVPVVIDRGAAEVQTALERLDHGSQGVEAAALISDTRALADRRQNALQDLARASLQRMGLGQFDIDGALPHDGDKTLEALHMRTCDLVRRTVMLLCALQKAGR